MKPAPRYGHLASAYDQLFPLDPEALAFVEASVGSIGGKHLVDAGCGTGLLARALGDRGASVFGFDLDPDLLALAQWRTGSGVRFAPGDLRTWELPPGFSVVDAVVCFGNTLPHLNQGDEVDAFLERSARALVPGGLFLLQVLDYDYLLASQTLVLPLREVGGWVFDRRYEIRPDGLWTFHTSLSWPGGRGSNAFELRPWRREELEEALGRQGFAVDGVFGGFDGRPPGNSLPLVLRARLL